MSSLCAKNRWQLNHIELRFSATSRFNHKNSGHDFVYGHWTMDMNMICGDSETLSSNFYGAFNSEQ